MEQKFGKNSIDIEALREFCEREGETVEFFKGDQLEREGDPARWFGFVTEGCFKYVNHSSDDREHITWFSFAGEFVVDYPTFLYGQPSQTTIEAMMPSRVLRVAGQQLEQYFNQSIETMKLRAVIAEHILFQFRSRYLDLHCATPRERYEQLRYLDLHCATPRERYEQLLQRCPGIVEHLDLQDIASFLNVTPKTISIIRKNITFGKD